MFVDKGGQGSVILFVESSGSLDGLSVKVKVQDKFQTQLTVVVE